jgi:hypothetical protein
MSYYDYLRYEQYAEEARQDENDRRISKHFTGSLKPSNKLIIQKIKAAHCLAERSK